MIKSDVTHYIDDRVRTLTAVRDLLIRHLKVNRQPAEIDPDVPLFGTGLGLDSVDAIELMVAIESEFGISLPEGFEARSALRTVNTLVDLVHQHRAAVEVAS